MRMLPKQLLHILLHPRPLNTLSPSFETTGLEDEQQRNRSQSPHMLVPLPSSSPFFETKGLELEPQTNRSQSLHTPVSCCRPSRHFHYPASNMHPFSHPSPPYSPAPDPLSHPPLARARVQTRWPKVLCAVRLRICGVPESSRVFFPDIRFKVSFSVSVVVASAVPLHAQTAARCSV
jgi:hypothetical protein